MIFSLIVCTYNRSESLKRLLISLRSQTLYPDEILIVDGSNNNVTEDMLEENNFLSTRYFKVDEDHRGLTLQRNYGIRQVSLKSEFICFFDDDIVPERDYFEKLLKTYKDQPDAIAVGGWIVDDTKWIKLEKDKAKFDDFWIDGYIRKLGQRNVLRKILGLQPDKPPGFMPDFSHGFSTGFLPPSGRTFPVEFFMGGVSSYRKKLFKDVNFSKRFVGYGLYEDMDFCIRIQKFGKLYLNTAAKVKHLHEESGRPNYMKYGEMMINNGYYVWRLKHSNPSFIAKIKWYLINLLLLLIRMFNGLKNKDAFDDFKGRVLALAKLLFNNKSEQLS